MALLIPDGGQATSHKPNGVSVFLAVAFRHPVSPRHEISTRPVWRSEKIDLKRKMSREKYQNEQQQTKLHCHGMGHFRQQDGHRRSLLRGFPIGLGGCGI